MKKNNNKGFTLVELIVVLVILAILAAILVPALLGYIDKARNAQFEEEAHSILTAAQAYATEQYAKDPTSSPETALGDATVQAYVNKIVTPTYVNSGTITYGINANASATTSAHADFTVQKIENLSFKPQKGQTVTCTIEDGAITIDKVED